MAGDDDGGVPVEPPGIRQIEPMGCKIDPPLGLVLDDLHFYCIYDLIHWMQLRWAQLAPRREEQRSAVHAVAPGLVECAASRCLICSAAAMRVRL